MERKILKALLFIGIGLLPAIFKDKLNKDWVIIFLLKAYLSSFLDHIVTGKKRITYPVRFLPKYFRINILFDYLLFPLLCVFYNQVTYRSNLMGIFLKVLLFSIPMTLVEVFLERKTKLIKFKKNWHWYYTLLSETFIILFVRMFIGLIRNIQSKKAI